MLLAFATTVAIVTGQATAIQRLVSLQYAEQLAETNASQTVAQLEKALDVTRVLAQSLGGIRAAGTTDRNDTNALRESVLEGNPEFLSVWTCCEPDGFDGNDAPFAGKPGHDATGRVIPYWNRGAGTAAQEPQTDYDKPGAGHYYGPAKTC